MTITIKTDFINEEEIKKSRFICHLKRISTEEEARDFIAKIKKEHWKANHNCSAYTLGNRQEIQRSSDDGEPSGTAGVPMLEILKKKEIHLGLGKIFGVIMVLIYFPVPTLSVRSKVSVKFAEKNPFLQKYKNIFSTAPQR